MKNIIRKLKVAIPTLVLLLTLASQFISQPLVFACGSATGNSKEQILNGTGQTGSNCNGSGVTNTVSAAVSILSYIVGIAAIIMIVVSAFRFITSGGDSTKVSGAKSALVYALIGVAIAAVAQFLVQFVLVSANNSVN